MHEVRNKTTYFFVDRSKGKTYYIGDFDKLIVFLAERIHFENRKDYVTQRFDKRDFIYDNWDFSGGDVHWVTDHKLVWERYFDWNIEKFVSGWHDDQGIDGVDDQVCPRMIKKPVMVEQWVEVEE